MEKEQIYQEITPCSKLLKTGEAFIMRVITFTDIKKAIEERYNPSGAAVIFYDMGKGCGKRSVKRFMSKYKDKVKLLNAIAKHKKYEGWGGVEFKIDLKKQIGEVIVSNSFEAKQYGASSNPVCYFFKGYLSGVLSEVLERDVNLIEEECIAKGDKVCRFKLTPPSS
ncbi:MAG: V4R domain-containing protein [Nitrososphaerales archaeon]